VVTNSYASWGSSGVQSAAQYMRSKGGVVVTSAGNQSTRLTDVNPSSVTTVSATDESDAKASWSNYGSPIDVGAPGTNVYCTTGASGYGTCWGTSFSAPITAAVYALMFGVNPNLSPEQADNLLYKNADDLSTAGWDEQFGYGRVNAFRAVEAAKNAVGTRDAVPPTTPANLKITGVTASSIGLSWGVSSDDNTGVSGYNVYRDGVKIATTPGISYTQSNLTPATTYAFTVSAVDGAGNESVKTSSLGTTTLPVAFGIASYSVSSKTNTSATISTTLTKSGSVTVRYGTTAANLSMTASGVLSGTAHSVPLTGLQGGMTYYYQVVATDAGGVVVTSPTSSFKTTKGGGKPGR
jgi:thermitase